MIKIRVWCLTFFLFCCSSRYYSTKGIIYATGNEPFVQLALEEENHTTHIISQQSPAYDELWKYQGQKIQVTIDRKKSSAKKEIYIISFEIIQ
ncbi:MAG: hypothetical protein D6813_04905 [Calditrichaeota bacterium]|nr:MAG: hypothetical protein D6813_04905 [Calditrichota bacterium]